MTSLLLFFTEHWLLSWYIFSLFYFWLYVGVSVQGHYLNLLFQWFQAKFNVHFKIGNWSHFFIIVVAVYASPGVTGVIGLGFILISICFVIGAIALYSLKRLEEIA